MSRLDNLEGSLRKILKDQLQELVRRSAPLAEKNDRDRLSLMIEDMINSWIEADPRSRKIVLAASLRRVRAHIQQIKAVRAAKDGVTIVSNECSPRHLSGKGYVRVSAKDRDIEELGFYFLSPRGSKKVNSINDAEALSGRKASREIAKRLGLDETHVDGVRRKLRLSGLDIAFVAAASSFRTSGKGSAKASAASKRYD
jgi:hypothetical protein